MMQVLFGLPEQQEQAAESRLRVQLAIVLFHMWKLIDPIFHFVFEISEICQEISVFKPKFKVSINIFFFGGYHQTFKREHELVVAHAPVLLETRKLIQHLLQEFPQLCLCEQLLLSLQDSLLDFFDELQAVQLNIQRLSGGQEVELGLIMVFNEL